MENKKNYFKTTALEKISKMKKGAIYQAIRVGKLKASKMGSSWQISLEDFYDYVKNRYSRDKSTFNGQPLYDRMKGECSVNQAAKLMRTTASHVYNLLYTNRLPYKKKGSAYIIDIKDLKEAKKHLL